MSKAGAPEVDVPNSAGVRVAVVASSWHEVVMAGLVAGATRTLEAAEVAEVAIIRVPGSFELPLAAQACAQQFDAVVALGVVIRGGTPHFDYVCRAATEGLAQVSLATGCPIGFGVLTCDDEKQALDRAGLPDSAEDKGAEAAEAALAMVHVLRGLAGDSTSLRPS